VLGYYLPIFLLGELAAVIHLPLAPERISSGKLGPVRALAESRGGRCSRPCRCLAFLRCNRETFSRNKDRAPGCTARLCRKSLVYRDFTAPQACLLLPSAAQ